MLNKVYLVKEPKFKKLNKLTYYNNINRTLKTPA